MEGERPDLYQLTHSLTEEFGAMCVLGRYYDVFPAHWPRITLHQMFNWALDAEKVKAFVSKATDAKFEIASLDR